VNPDPGRLFDRRFDGDHGGDAASCKRAQSGAKINRQLAARRAVSRPDAHGRARLATRVPISSGAIGASAKANPPRLLRLATETFFIE